MESKLFAFKFNKDISQKQDTPNSQKFALSNADFIELRKVVYDLSGIYLPENGKQALEKNIAKKITANNLKNFFDYMRTFQSPLYREELNDLFDAILLNENYFFRDDDQFEAFEKIIVPEIIKTKTEQSNPYFRIWSAAAATGEEAYSIAIVIQEKLMPVSPDIKFQILASDINNQSLTSARKGIYKENSVMNLPLEILEKYFEKNDDLFVLKDEIKKLVKFMKIDLLNTEMMKTLKTCDVVFCSNVLTFFDNFSRQKVVSYLYEALNKGGYLFLGSYESLHGISKSFKLVHLPRTIAYKKE
jgi:chemotaxis protein methyltransferase CheR